MGRYIEGKLGQAGQFEVDNTSPCIDDNAPYSTQIAGTQPTHPPTFSIPVFRWFGNTVSRHLPRSLLILNPRVSLQSIAPGIVKTEARIKQLDRKRTGNDSCSPALEREGFVDTKTSLFDAQDTTYPSATALDHLLEVFISHFVSCHQGGRQALALIMFPEDVSLPIHGQRGTTKAKPKPRTIQRTSKQHLRPRKPFLRPPQLPRLQRQPRLLNLRRLLRCSEASSAPTTSDPDARGTTVVHLADMERMGKRERCWVLDV
jgi:hypothetical protein